MQMLYYVTINFLSRIDILFMFNHILRKVNEVSVYGHTTLNTPVLVRSLKLSNIEPSQYLDGWPPGNTGCCWLSFFSWFEKIFAFLGKIWVIKYILALFLVLVHLKIHGNWSKFEENPFSRGFVGFYESFREFLRGSVQLNKQTIIICPV